MYVWIFGHLKINIHSVAFGTISQNTSAGFCAAEYCKNLCFCAVICYTETMEYVLNILSQAATHVPDTIQTKSISTFLIALLLMQTHRHNRRRRLIGSRYLRCNCHRRRRRRLDIKI